LRNGSAYQEFNPNNHFNLNIMLKYLSSLTFFCFLCSFSSMSQPNYKIAPSASTSNFFTLVDEFQSWYDTVQLPDSVKIRHLKKFGRWASFWENRVHYGDSSLDGLFHPYQQSLGAYWVNPSCSGQDDARWESVGPYPEDLQNMGYIQSIWFDKTNPDLILVGSGRISGILKSEDRGQTWRDVLTPSRIPALGITYITASPVTNQNGNHTFYASTGSDMVGYSLGILKSDDDGETWNILPDFPLFANQEFNYIVRKVLAAPVHPGAPNPDILFAIAKNQFFKSTDGGATWSSLTLQIQNVDYNGTLDDLEVDPQNNDIIAISGLPTAGGPPSIWLSTDGGVTFNEIFATCGYANFNDISNIQIDFPGSERLYVLTREPNHGSIFYYHFDPILSGWNVSNTNNYKIDMGPRSQFNRTFKVSNDFYHFFIGTECFSISTESTPGSCTHPYYEPTVTFHPDIRCIATNSDIIMLGTDGGLMATFDLGQTWHSLNGVGPTGIFNNEVVGFDISNEFEPNVVVGLIDNSFKFFNKKWHSSTPLEIMEISTSAPPRSDPNGIGDAGKCIFDSHDPFKFFIIGSYGLSRVTLQNGVDFEVLVDFNNFPQVVYGYDWFRVPIVANHNTPSMMYLGGLGLTQSSSGAISRSDDFVSWDETSLGSPAGMVNNIVVAPGNPDVLYATTIHRTGSGTVCEGGIYRSVDGGDTWKDITGVINFNPIPNQNYSITDVTVDWNNPDRVWVCLGGVSFDNATLLPILENKVFRTDDASAQTVHWYDMTHGLNPILPPLPANAIINQPGTDRVFLATDGGIFYRGISDPDWTCFSNGFPITNITDLKINKITNEIFACTYGYGIWKSPLPCENVAQSYTIDQTTGNVTWSDVVRFSGDIIIKNGHKLTIDQRSVVYMAPGASILVEKGAELILDNASLTSCDQMWQGIKVMGNWNMNQDGNNQGLVSLLNGATIANARVGIETGNARSAGGIIQAENAYFYNCEYGVKMHPYRNFSPTNSNITWSNRGYLKNCKFSTTKDLQISTIKPKSHIWLNGIQRLSIQGNKFENSHHAEPIGPDRGKGIEAFNSVFYVDDYCTTSSIPCGNTIANKFIGLHYGVYAMATNPLTPISIINAHFDSNSFGTYLNGITGARVSGSFYTIPPDLTQQSRAYGLYLDHCTGYTIEENHFLNGTPLTNHTVGMIINNSGRYYNVVYNNTFTDLGYGILTQHDNRGPGQNYGLQVKCNDFSQVINVDLGISRRESYTGITGISVFQGGNTSVTAPAGNTFSRSLNNPFSEIHNNGQVISKYFHHAIQGTTPTNAENWVPIYYNSPRVLLEEVPNLPYSKSQACPLNSSIPPLNKAQLYDELSNHAIDAVSATLILDIYRDGGIAELPEMVALAYPWETYEYFNLLMLESPYLSEQTLIAAINNTDLLPDLLLKLILIANPHGTRLDEVMGALVARDPQLPEYIMDEILLCEELPSPLEGLEAAVAYHKHQQYTILNQIIQQYLADSSLTIASDSLAQIFSRDPLVDLKYMRAYLYLMDSSYSNALAYMEAIGALVGGEDYVHQIFEECNQVFPISVKMVRDSCEYWSLTAFERETLWELAINGQFFPSAYARAILLQHDSTYEYEEPIIFPVSESARKRTTIKPANPSNMPLVNIYPNPAKDYFVFDYQLDKDDLDATLRLTNSQGRLVQQYTISQPIGQQLIEVRTLADGLYLLTLITGRNQVITRKITIAN
jgi:hypothetical protein